MRLGLFLIITLFIVTPFSGEAGLLSSLKEEIQQELEVNPFLKKQGIVLKVVEVESGYVTLEMVEGNRLVREKIKNGQDVESTQWNNANPEEKNSINALKRTIDVIKGMEGVKAIALEASTNKPEDMAEDKKLKEALDKIAKQQHYKKLSRWHDICSMVSFDRVKIDKISKDTYRYKFKSKWKITGKTTGEKKEGFAVYSIWLFDGFSWDRYQRADHFDPMRNLAAMASGKINYIPIGDVFNIKHYIDIKYTSNVSKISNFNTPSLVWKKFVDNIKMNKIDEAINLIIEEQRDSFRRDDGFNGFIQMVQQRLEEVLVTNEEIEGDKAILETSFISTDGRNKEDKVSLVMVGGAWMIKLD